MTLLYRLAVQGYGGLIRLAALFSGKARKWVEGRKNWRGELKNSIPSNRKVFWMHCASLGEFEQGRPILEAVRKDHPAWFILLSFFSPSGYEIRKNTPLADRVVYLPLDGPAAARDFLDLARPSVVVFVKYEFWYFFLREISKRKIRAFLVSGLFRPKQSFFRPYGRFFRKMLPAFTHFFVQNEESARLLASIGYHEVTVSGDNRIDSVAQNADRARQFPLVANFCSGSRALICGSTHSGDDKVLIPFLNHDLPPHWKVIYAPHEIKTGNLSELKQKLGDRTVFYSSLKDRKEYNGKDRFLIIDNVGMLAQLYQYGSLAYIGGGFGKGVHNLLEPMAFGLPCIFGPRYQKFEEARFLVEHKAGKSIDNSEELEAAFRFFLEEADYERAVQKAGAYIASSRGATEKVMGRLTREME